jgi:glyoxylase-like metal-dependent hydrolase (beta-lactamase superfamily II)
VNAEAELAPGHPEIGRIVAPNPGPMTLGGTCTYLFGSDPCVVIDPGPAIESHIEAIRAAGEERGGIEGTLLTHGHADHSDGVRMLGEARIELADGEQHSGLTALATPGHAPDHLCFLTTPAASSASRPAAAGIACFSGDIVLGEGSSIVPADPGAMNAYLDSLRRLQEIDLELICPGHGPWVTDPAAKLEQYVEHRLMRERRLVAALERGERSRAALLDEVWDDVAAPLRPAAAIAMQAHLQKLEADGRLPSDLGP